MSKKQDGVGASRVHRQAGSSFNSHPLTELRIANVKSLTGEHLIPLAPLTLVYGPNAAGKSTIIQSLLLLAQSVQADTFAPRGPLIDVRDFRHVVSGHNLSQELTIGVRFIVEDEDADAVMIASINDDPREVPPIRFDAGMSLTFQSADDGRPPYVHATLAIAGCTLIEPDPAPIIEGFDDTTGPWGPYLLRWKLDLGDVTATEALASTLERVESLRGDVRRSAALLRFASELVESGHADSATLESWVDPIDWEGGFHAPADLRLRLEPAKTVGPELAPVSVDGCGLPDKDRADAEALLKQWATGEPEMAVFSGLRPIAELLGRVEGEARGLFRSDSLDEDHSAAARRYRDRREWDGRPEAKLVSLGPIRPTPRRAHLDDEVPDSAALALIQRLYRNDSLLGRVNEWLERLEVPYSVAVDRLVSRTNPDFARGYSFELTDTRTNVEVSLADVGYGVSQVLPIVTECVGASASIICIEQPELHLHPRLAGNLAELLVETTTHGNQVIAETHSENILLRVQRLIRERVIAAADVAVLYVDNKPGVGASVTRLHLDDEGDLLTRWPGGFFDDRLADVLGITS